MAKETVMNFLSAAQAERGPEFSANMWRRIKLGYALTDAVPTTPVHDGTPDDTPEHLKYTPLTREDFGLPDRTRPGNEDMEKAFIDIIAAKAHAAHGIHAGVHTKFGGKSLEEWLEPKRIHENAPAFVKTLGSSSMWITPGKLDCSRLVQECEWGSKMFGAFSAGEVGTIRGWWKDSHK